MAILKAISTLPSLKEGSTESLLDEQWLNFAYDVVKPELQVTHDLEGKVWKPLHAALEGRVYFNGTFKPSLADWTLFALLANHIVWPNLFFKINLCFGGRLQWCRRWAKSTLD